MINRPPQILVINSDLKELVIVESFIRNIFDTYKLSEKHFKRTYLCVSEAVINSIKHGNKSDRNKQVSVTIGCTKNEITVLIEDQGNGFDYSIVCDPTIEENIRNESGRGIHIIKALTDKVEYNRKGNIVQFKINCSE